VRNQEDQFVAVPSLASVPIHGGGSILVCS
jgi:hypothetical protein